MRHVVFGAVSTKRSSLSKDRAAILGHQMFGEVVVEADQRHECIAAGVALHQGPCHQQWRRGYSHPLDDGQDPFSSLSASDEFVRMITILRLVRTRIF